MQIVIITGMSGAGKTIALKTMEDMGYYSVDNMPVNLVVKFAEIISETGSGNVAVGIDIRNAEKLTDLGDVLDELEDKGIRCTVLFLDASNAVLLKRFKETRRSHPLSPSGHIADGIEKEREELKWLKKRSDYVIDTSGMKTRNLRGQLELIFGSGRKFKNLYLNILSFGYKYGIPEDADIVIDVRFLPNPFYVEGLKEKTGLDQEVRDYVLKNKDADEFTERLTGLIDFLIPRYIDEGKNQLVIAFGCTGGKHRSVTIAETVYSHLKENADYGLNVEHRDIKK
ncbi:MAG: RNase adapter RapZ [Eubacteriales bacterium]|nr:RNase adapter RapZ [Eubacteriales bacterium]